MNRPMKRWIVLAEGMTEYAYILESESGLVARYAVRVGTRSYWVDADPGTFHVLDAAPPWVTR